MNCRRLMAALCLFTLLVFTLDANAQLDAVACPGFLPSRLVIGESGRVLPETHNHLRESASTDSAVLGSIPVGGRFAVLEGPICDPNGIAWWRVDYQGSTGWTAEGAGQQYWTEPLIQITIDNVTSLTEKMRLGRGGLRTKVLWLADNRVAVGGDFGIWLYDGDDFDAPPDLLESGPVKFVDSISNNRLATVACAMPACTADIVMYWDLVSGDLLQSIELNETAGSLVAFNADGTRAVSRTPDNTINLWDMPAALKIRAFQPHNSPVQALAISPDGMHIASGDTTGEMALWKANTGEKISLPNHAGSIPALEFSPDGKKLISASVDETVRWWNVETAQMIRSTANNADIEDPYCMYGCNPSDGKTTAADLVFSADGRLLAGANWAGTLTIWEASTGKQLRVIDIQTYKPLSSVAFSPDGRYLANNAIHRDYDNDNSIKVWEIETELLTATMQSGHTGWPANLAFSPSGLTLASASYTFDGSVRLWDITTGEQRQVLHPFWAMMTEVAFSLDGQILFTGGEAACGECSISRVWLWNATTGTLWNTLEGDLFHPSSRIAVSPNGQWMAATLYDSQSVTIWDVQTALTLTEEEQQIQAQHSIGGENLYINKLIFSPDSVLLAASSSDLIYLWDAETGDIQHTLTNGALIWDIVFSPDGHYLAAGSGKIGLGGRVEAVSGGENVIRIWDVETGEEVAVLEHAASGVRLAFHPDGSVLASISPADKLYLWDTETYELIAEYESACGVITALSFNPDGTLLAIGCGDNTIRLWGID